MTLSADVVLSMLRSWIRARTMLVLGRVKETTPTRLARMVGTTPDQLRMALKGHPPRYDKELAPLTLGLIEYRPARRGRKVVITPEGQRVAEELYEWRRRAPDKFEFG